MITESNTCLNRKRKREKYNMKFKTRSLYQYIIPLGFSQVFPSFVSCHLCPFFILIAFPLHITLCWALTILHLDYINSLLESPVRPNFHHLFPRQKHLSCLCIIFCHPLQKAKILLSTWNIFILSYFNLIYFHFIASTQYPFQKDQSFHCVLPAYSTHSCFCTLAYIVSLIFCVLNHFLLLHKL